MSLTKDELNYYLDKIERPHNFAFDTIRQAAKHIRKHIEDQEKRLCEASWNQEYIRELEDLAHSHDGWS